MGRTWKTSSPGAPGGADERPPKVATVDVPPSPRHPARLRRALATLGTPLHLGVRGPAQASASPASPSPST